MQNCSKVELAYWADVLHKPPLTPADQDEPYTSAAGEGLLPKYEGGPLNSFRGFTQNWGGRGLDKEK